MKKIIIGFSTSIKPFAPICWAIKQYQGTNYSHVYLRVQDSETLQQMIYQATGIGINCIYSQNFLQNNKIVAEFSIEIEDSIFLKIKEFINEQLGKPYSHLQYIDILLSDVYAFFDKQYKPKFSDGENSYICSEFIAYILEEISPKFMIPKRFDLIKPRDIYPFLLEHKEFKQIKG
jgi:hypothetical protein